MLLIRKESNEWSNLIRLDQKAGANKLDDAKCELEAIFIFENRRAGGREVIRRSGDGTRELTTTNNTNDCEI